MIKDNAGTKRRLTRNHLFQKKEANELHMYTIYNQFSRINKVQKKKNRENGNLVAILEIVYNVVKIGVTVSNGHTLGHETMLGLLGCLFVLIVSPTDLTAALNSSFFSIV